MTLFKNIFICFFVLIQYQIYAQKQNQTYQFIKIKEGMPKIGVSTIIQDDFGFIWIGTNGSGIYKYNGISFDAYKSSPNDSTAISSNLIHCSLIDDNKRLWVGTEEGLNLYDKDKDQFKKIKISPIENTNINIPILGLKTDHKGNLFVGTFDQGMFKVNLKTLKSEKIISQNKTETTPISVYNFAIDKHDNVYVTTSKGLKKYDDKTKSLKLAKFSGKNGFMTIEDPTRTIIKDINNILWIGTLNGMLYRIEEIDDFNEEFNIDNFKISNNIIFTVISLPDSTLMIGTENNGLFHLEPNGKLIKNYLQSKTDETSILSNSIWSLYLDRDKRIWLGYYNKGVVVYDKLYDKFKNFESLSNNLNSLQNSSVTAITKDKDGKLWVGMDGGGIDIIDKKTKKFTHINTKSNTNYSGLTTDYIETIFIDRDENVWAGSWNGGIYFLKKGSKTFINYNSDNTNGQLNSNIILSFDQDSEGTIWISTVNGGLSSYNPKTKKFKYYNSAPIDQFRLNDAFIWKVLVDKHDNIWIGTTSGLYRMKKNKNEPFSIESISDKNLNGFDGNKIPAYHILSLYEGSNNSIWFGTRGAGLCQYNVKADTFTWYNELNGLKEENVCAITETTDGNIWLSGNTGLTKFDVKNKTFTNYSKNDGLLSNDFNMNAVYKDTKETLYFGNYQGIDFFNPSNIIKNKKPATLYLYSLKIFNEKIEPSSNHSPLKKVISETNNITLNNNQSVFTLEYGALNYTRPEKVQYAYYLEGYENDWNYVGKKRSATYTNLDPGDYTFKLKAANNDGVWNNKPLTLNITILPPWWKTNWAIGSYLGLFLLGLYLLNYYTQNRLKEKAIIRNERIQRQQVDELNEKKIQFFTNISHEFRTPLTLMISPLEDIINDSSLILPERIKEKHKVIYKNTNRLYRLINELLDFRKLEINKVKIRAKELNLVDLTKDVVSYFKEEAHVKNINLNVDYDINNILIWADEQMLEKIIFNILSNAFKVTPENGNINIELLSKDTLLLLPLAKKTPIKVFEIKISDTGPGLDQEETQRIFERFYQVENLNKTYYGGTGIGLEVVLNFVELHKGKIEVESKKGQGTTFKIFLPAGKEHFSENEIILNDLKESIVNEEINYNTKTSETDLEKSTITNTILIVEDNTELRNYLKEELKNDYKILTAKNGIEGLKLAQEFLPNVIMTDIIMPEMDGYLFCKHIKEDMRTSHIPLLMLTAKARIENRMEGIEIGADAYMVKPFDMRLLKLRLSQLITSRQLIFNKYFSFITDAPNNVISTSPDKEFIEKVLNYINVNLGDPDLNVESLASELNLSRSQFYRKIKALTNQTANEFLRNIRLQKAKQIIEMGNNNISEVCYDVGFSSPSYFAKCFKNYFGILPTEVKSSK